MLKKIIIAVCLVAYTWLGFSFVDIISDNNEPNPQHSNINAFVVYSEMIND